MIKTWFQRLTHAPQHNADSAGEEEVLWQVHHGVLSLHPVYEGYDVAASTHVLRVAVVVEARHQVAHLGVSLAGHRTQLVEVQPNDLLVVSIECTQVKIFIF